MSSNGATSPGAMPQDTAAGTTASLIARKRGKFTQQQALAIMSRHVGMRGFARRRAGQCEVGVLAHVADAQVLGTGRSYRRALEAAGVWFANGNPVL
jgi:hypothetical protein